jgi:hypothetical protein
MIITSALSMHGSAGSPVVPTGEFLVDEISGPDTNLKNHPDVYWYATPNATDHTQIIGTHWEKWWASWMVNWSPYWIGPGDPGINNGNATHTLDPTYGVYVTNFGSPFKPDHFVRSAVGAVAVYATSNPDGLTIQSWRKWLTNQSMIAYGADLSLNPTIFGAGNGIPELYLRYMIYIDPDVDGGMNEHHMKLGGHEAGKFGAAPDFGYAKPVPGSGQVQLTKYGGTFNNAAVDHQSFSPPRYLSLGQWHSLEIYTKVNSAPGVSDGNYKMWHNNDLIQNSTGQFYPVGTTGTPLLTGLLRAQIFHGGWGDPGTTNPTPLSCIHHKSFGWVLARRRIGKAKVL